MKKIQIFKFKAWLYRLLTTQVVKQDRSLRWKLSHYASKVLVILLIAEIIIPYLGSNLAKAGEEIEHGKVLGASTTNIVYNIASPLYGKFKMNSKDDLKISFVETEKLTNQYIREIQKSISKIANDRVKISQEIERTKKDIETMKMNLSELVVSLTDESQISFYEQLLSEESFARMDERIAQDEAVFSEFKKVLESLRAKQESLNLLIQKLDQEKVVINKRIKESEAQKNQLKALNQGVQFFDSMDDLKFQNFISKEQKKLNEFEKEIIESEQENLEISTKVLSKQKEHLESLAKMEEEISNNINEEIKELEIVEEEIDTTTDETQLEDLLNLLSFDNLKSGFKSDRTFGFALFNKAYALSPKVLEAVKIKLQKSTKLSDVEKAQILKVKNDTELKKVVISVLARMKKEKEAKKNEAMNTSKYASSVATEVAESMKVFTKIIPGKALFNKHPLAENPVMITAEYGSKTYEKVVGMFHNGVDMGIPQNTPIYAIADGVVKSAVFDDTPSLAYLIIIHNEEKKMSAYLHLSKILVKDLDIVKKGQLVGYSGGTPGTPGAGMSSGPHLHFEIRELNNVRENPYPSSIPGNPPVLKFVGF